MISRLKLSQKLFIIVAILAIPLGLVSIEYVQQTRDLSLRNLDRQISAMPLLEDMGKLTRLLQDQGSSLPLWIIGADISLVAADEQSRAIRDLVKQINGHVANLEAFDAGQWGALAERVLRLQEHDGAKARGFEEYAALTSDLIQYTRYLTYSFKFYSGTTKILTLNRLTFDLTPSLADDINLLRGLVTYKAFIKEKNLKDVSRISSYLSLAEFRYREILLSSKEFGGQQADLASVLVPEINRLESKMQSLKSQVEVFAADLDSGIDPEAFYKECTDVLAMVHAIREMGSQRIRFLLEQDHQAHNRRLNFLIGISICSALLVFALAYLMSRSFIRGVRQIEFLTERIASGQRDVDFPVVKEADEIQSIQAQIQKIYLAVCASEDKVKEGTWMLEAQKALNDQLRGESNLEAFARKAVKTIAESICADIGSFYHTRDGHLKRSFNFGSQSPERIEKGEGLLGAAALDGQMRSYGVETLPEDYSRIGSSLGEGRAKGLIIFPVCIQNEILAVLEFLAFKPFHPRDLNFLGAIEENTAILLRSTLSKIKVSELLAMTEVQREELLTKNSDLETTSKLLNEQQQLLQEVNEELEEQRGELEAQNEKLEQVVQNLAVAKQDAEEKSREAEVANRYKSAFLANMSHELRTPLNSIMILSQVLADNRVGNLDEAQIKNAHTIHTAGRDLLQLINDILDLSKIEAGKLDINLGPISVADIAQETQTMYEALAQKKQLTYSVHVAKDCPDTIHSDPVRLAQIIRNFVANAIKFTETGEVTVRFSATNRGPYALQILVEDSGIGIPPQQLERIFEPFKQLNNSLARKHEGTGLGLSIAKSLAEKLGGRIEVDSQVGKGSRFCLLLPSQSPETAESRETAQQKPFLEDDRQILKADDYVILIVEDDPNFAEVLRGKCRAANFRCVISPLGKDCVSLAERYQPYGIILDIKLPDRDGLQVLGELKGNARTRHIPVHVISFADREREAIGGGAISFVQKPVSAEKLDHVLSSLKEGVASKARLLLLAESEEERSEIVRLLSGMSLDSAGSLEAVIEAMGIQQDYDGLILSWTVLSKEPLKTLESLSEKANKTRLPIVILSEPGQFDEVQKRMADLGLAYPVKSVGTQEHLLDDVTLFIHSVDSQIFPRRATDAALLKENVFEEKKVLIVDDDIRNVYSLRQILQGRGCELLVATNGQEALDALAEHSDIDLVLMDIMMPVMDGYEAMRQIRKNPRFRKLPVIALTAKAMKNDREQCLAAGASDYLVKPIDTEKLIMLMRVWLSR